MTLAPPNNRRSFTARLGWARLPAIRPWAALTVLLAGTCVLEGCCSGIGKSLLIGSIPNGSAVARQVDSTKPKEYSSAFEDVLDVLSCLNTGCPPKHSGAEADAPQPLQLDFNLLHQFLGPDDRIRVATVPPVNPGEFRTAGDIDRLYGISESDNFRFAVAPRVDLFLYLFGIDAAGEVEWYYPKVMETEEGPKPVNPWADAEGVNPTPADAVVLMPKKRQDWLYLPPVGRNGVENFFLVASRSRQIGLEQALARAVTAATKEKERSPSVFAQTILRRPLMIPDERSGVVDRAGTPRREVRAVATPHGPVVYGPRAYQTDRDSLILARSVLHLPPRSP